MKDITFVNVRGYNDLYPPEPANRNIPEWYKDTEPYLQVKIDNVNETNATIKKCMPVFDILSSGYILKTPLDILVSQTIDENGNKTPHYRWPNEPGLGFHPRE